MFCRLYQWRIEKEVDDYGEIKHSRTLRHLEVCSSCQGWLQSLKQIGCHLQTDSPIVSNLHMRQVQVAVQRHLSDATADHSATTYPKKSIPYRFRYAISAAAAVMMVVIGLFSWYSEPDQDIHLHPNHDEMVAEVADISKQLQYQFPALVSLPEQMLESEMQNMEIGVRHAIGFFQNCLPQELVAANLSSENIDSL